MFSIIPRIPMIDICHIMNKISTLGSNEIASMREGVHIFVNDVTLYCGLNHRPEFSAVQVGCKGQAAPVLGPG